MSKYREYEKIGEGGGGTVYRAIRLEDGLQVAIKYPHEGAGPEELHRFKREARQLLGMSHENIIKILDHDLDAERPYFVMPFMTPLTQWVGKLTHEQVRGVLRCLVNVLHYLHGTGALHRDVKPDNVLVDGNGKINVIDFGHGNNPRFTVMFTINAFGTHGYAAPELMLPNAVASPAADIYSLGATIFHLVTGTHPLRAVAPLDMRKHVADVPADLHDVVTRMVARTPAQRPTAEQLAEMLGIRVTKQVAPAATQGSYTPRHTGTTMGGGRYG